MDKVETGAVVRYHNHINELSRGVVVEVNKGFACVVDEYGDRIRVELESLEVEDDGIKQLRAIINVLTGLLIDVRDEIRDRAMRILDELEQ